MAIDLAEHELFLDAVRKRLDVLHAWLHDIKVKHGLTV